MYRGAVLARASPWQPRFDNRIEERKYMRVHKRRLAALSGVVAVAAATVGFSLPGATSAHTAKAAAAATPIGIALTYNNTAFWAAYINYESQYAKQMNISCSARCSRARTQARRTPRSTTS
jgi:hypothetical protein